jgi:hypothetical protein
MKIQAAKLFIIALALLVLSCVVSGKIHQFNETNFNELKNSQGLWII